MKKTFHKLYLQLISIRHTFLVIYSYVCFQLTISWLNTECYGDIYIICIRHSSTVRVGHYRTVKNVGQCRTP